MPSQAVEVVELLARRATLLRLLRQAPRLKRDIAEELSVSRSTVDRAVRNLESHNYVVREETVSLTLEGRLALDAFERFTGSIGGLDDASEVLGRLPAAASLDVAMLRDATVVTPDRDAPQRPIASFVEEAERATAVRGFGSAVLPTVVSVFHDRIVYHDAVFDLTVPDGVLDELLSTQGDVVDECLDAGGLTLRTATSGLDYSLMIVEQRDRTVACALVYGDSGLAGVVKNDNDDAVRSADCVYERVRENASDLPI
ncbi:helix-turn-helix transcriptional regulator [Halobacterium wangiae]|uniref:helix-turn-helix transcriptional regulator n=1 Tax=Halobacterium wangiae TaxID=2902623 RepID=UPI001E4AE674|nr:helix-turn-helix domain-containing protein [Halobacterium wangiae]